MGPTVLHQTAYVNSSMSIELMAYNLEIADRARLLPTICWFRLVVELAFLFSSSSRATTSKFCLVFFSRFFVETVCHTPRADEQGE